MNCHFVCQHPSCFCTITSEALNEHLQSHAKFHVVPVIETSERFKQSILQKLASLRQFADSMSFQFSFDDQDYFSKLKVEIYEIISKIIDEFANKRRELLETLISLQMESLEDFKLEIERIESLFITILDSDSEDLRNIIQEVQKMEIRSSELNKKIDKNNHFLNQEQFSMSPKIIESLSQNFKNQLASNFHSNSQLVNKISEFKKKEVPFQFEPKEYFRPSAKKRMFYFKENTKEVHLINFGENHLTQNWKKICLNIPFKIPKKHSSIITPTGDIYLMGGAEPDYSINKLNKTYLFDESNETLNRKSPFQYPRVGAATVYFQSNIYLIGGKTTKEGYTNKCEKYSQQTDKWETICPLNEKAYLPSVCSFSETYIYKYGGLLTKDLLSEVAEKYSPISNKWTLLQLKQALDMQNFSTIGFNGHAIQINSKEILIIGGVSIEGKSGACCIVSLEEEVKNKSNKWNPGQLKERFRSVDFDFKFSGDKYGDVVTNDRIFSLRHNIKEGLIQLFAFSSEWESLQLKISSKKKQQIYQLKFNQIIII